MHELIIIGASAAGVSAAIYAKRRNLNFILLARDVGGEVATSGEIENYLGFPKTDGLALSGEFRKQLVYNGIKSEEAIVSKIERRGDVFLVQAKRRETALEFLTKTVLVATGVHPRKLGIPGEDEFKNKGVSYCTTCDGPLFKGKTVAVIGGGNSALESLLMLSTIAREIYSININAAFAGESVLIEKVNQLPNVKIVTDASTKKILGDSFVTSIEYQKKDTDEVIMHEVQGVFVHIGMLPNSDFIDLVEKNEFGEIKVDLRCQTSVPGIFAAGDVTDIPYKQISIASGQGTLALLAAVEYLNKLR